MAFTHDSGVIDPLACACTAVYQSSSMVRSCVNNRPELKARGSVPNAVTGLFSSLARELAGEADANNAYLKEGCTQEAPLVCHACSHCLTQELFCCRLAVEWRAAVVPAHRRVRIEVRFRPQLFRAL